MKKSRVEWRWAKVVEVAAAAVEEAVVEAVDAAFTAVEVALLTAEGAAAVAHPRHVVAGTTAAIGTVLAAGPAWALRRWRETVK